jgi:hypothetical protein
MDASTRSATDRTPTQTRWQCRGGWPGAGCEAGLSFVDMRPSRLVHRCVACNSETSDRRRRSKEHVVPRWLQRALRIEGQPIAIVHQGAMWSPEDSSVTARVKSKPIQVPSLDRFTKRSVCEGCNSGSMSRLETSAKNALTKLMSGVEPHKLIDDEREIVARWAMKTAYFVQTDETVVPREHLQASVGSGPLPLGSSLFAARLEEPLSGFVPFVSRDWAIGAADGCPATCASLMHAGQEAYKALFMFGRTVIGLTFVDPHSLWRPAIPSVFDQLWPLQPAAVEIPIDYDIVLGQPAHLVLAHLIGLAIGPWGPFCDTHRQNLLHYVERDRLATTTLAHPDPRHVSMERLFS